MKKILLILSGILFCFTGISQSVAPQVYATSGGHYTGTNVQLSFTIGEPIIETVSNTDNILTQGFHQTNSVNPPCSSPTSNVLNNSGTGSVTITCTASGGSGGSYVYKWYSDTSCTGTVLGTNSTLTVSTSGYYSCKTYISGYESSCYDCDYGYADVITGIEDIDFINYINIFPNPNTGEFVIEMEITKPENLEMKLLNVIGQVIYEESISKFSGVYQKTIDIGKQAIGIYTLQLIGDEGIINKKIIIE